MRGLSVAFHTTKVLNLSLSLKARDFPRIDTLTLKFPSDLVVNFRGLQYFVSGVQDCIIEKELKADPPVIRFKAQSKLTSCRTKYTITARGRMQWHWYSKFWVRAEVKEYE